MATLRTRTVRRIRVAMAGASLVGLGALAACSGGGPDASDAAEELAAALTAGDVSKVPTTASGRTNQSDLDRVLEGLGDSSPRVTVKAVTADDDSKDAAGNDTATVVLSTQRTVEGVEWTYETTAELVKAEDRWEVDWKPSIVADVTGQERLTVSTSAAERGDILGADDAQLVTMRPVVRFGIDKTRVDGDAAGTSAEALAKVLDIDADTYRQRVEAAGARAFVEALVLREDTGSDLVASTEGIPGARGIADERPLAPTRAFAQPVLGVVGDATAEIIEDSDGAITAGDQVGLSGLQKRYDEQLRGTPRVEISAVVENTDVEPRQVFRSEPQAGQPLRTTLEEDLQIAAEEILADVDPASAIVAIRPSTGAVLALASGPGGGNANTAATGRYAPGSTFKVVTALTFLRSGMTPESQVPCTETVTVDGRTFTNYSDYPPSAQGVISLTDAIAHSCNTAMIATLDQAPQDELADAAAALGLGRDIDLGTPAFLGAVPTEASGTERAASMIGQGTIEASPLAMAVVAASIQNHSLVTPVLLPDLDPAEPETPATPLGEKEAISVADLMRSVVTDGSARFLGDLPGAPVGAKTGTAEYGEDVPPRTHAWMIATQGDLAIAVFVEDGDSGSATAGPLLEKFLLAAQ